MEKASRMSGFVSALLALSALGLLLLDFIFILGSTVTPDPLLAKMEESKIIFSDAWFHQPQPTAAAICCLLTMLIGYILWDGNRQKA